jgi:hypothetical protein
MRTDPPVEGTGRSAKPNRSCRQCGKYLPDDADRRAKYCSPKCARLAKRARAAVKPTRTEPAHPTVRTKPVVPSEPVGSLDRTTTPAPSGEDVVAGILVDLRQLGLFEVVAALVRRVNGNGDGQAT